MGDFQKLRLQIFEKKNLIKSRKMSRRKTRTCRMISFEDLMRSELLAREGRCSRNALSRRQQRRSGGTKLTSDRARGKGRPRENRAVQEKRPRGMGMGKK